MTKDSTSEGHTALTGGSLCTLPLQGVAESRAKKIRGFPTKPLYSLAAGAGLESQENGHNPCRALRSPNARLSLLPNCPRTVRFGKLGILEPGTHFPRNPDSSMPSAMGHSPLPASIQGMLLPSLFHSARSFPSGGPVLPWWEKLRLLGGVPFSWGWKTFWGRHALLGRTIDPQLLSAIKTCCPPLSVAGHPGFLRSRGPSGSGESP